MFSLLSWKNLVSKLSFWIHTCYSQKVHWWCIPTFWLETSHRKFWTYFNRQCRNIGFTSENENENSISFLDIKISRDHNKFTTSVYSKPTFRWVFTNFGSFIPMSSKYNWLFTLIHRAFKLLKFGTFSLRTWQAKNYFWK